MGGDHDGDLWGITISPLGYHDGDLWGITYLGRAISDKGRDRLLSAPVIISSKDTVPDSPGRDVYCLYVDRGPRA